MSDNTFLFSDILALPVAKKVLTTMQRPPEGGSWQDWSGEGGFDNEVKLGAVSASSLGKVSLPAFVSSIYILVEENVIANPSAIPGSLFLGGDDWMIPDYDCSSSVRFEIVEPSLAYPIRYSFSKLTDRRFYGRKFNSSHRFVIVPCFETDDFPTTPSTEKVESIINKLKKRFKILGKENEGFLEDLPVGGGGFSYDFDPQKNNWLCENFRMMAETLVGDTNSDTFGMFVQIGIGGTMKFHGESRNVREDAQELLRRISEKNGYSFYDITYHAVGPQEWKDREKSRKKWKKPIHQELGTLTLEDGTCATVKLRIEKEGYVFTLDFDDVDGLAAFRETKYFQKTHWNLGAE